VSEPVSGAAPPPSSSGGGKKTGGLTRNQWIIVALVGVGAVAWFWWKRSKSASSAASTSAAGTQGAATGGCTDASGNPTPCEEMAGIDYSGQLSTMQTELESILAAESIPAPAGPAGPSGPAGPAGPTGPAPSPPGQVTRYPAVAFTATKLNNTSALVKFKPLSSPTPVPSTYTIEAWTVAGQVASQQTVSAPDSTGGQGQYTVTGLKHGTCYNVRVWANGGKQAPPGNTEKVCV
jgi:hypothetical protein